MLQKCGSCPKPDISWQEKVFLIYAAHGILRNPLVEFTPSEKKNITLQFGTFDFALQKASN